MNKLLEKIRATDPLLVRFCLYGFLKNQAYFEPFLILALREKGLSFFQIGALVALRHIVLNACEIPSGALADLYGRRRAMVTAFSAYVLAFAALALGSGLALPAVGMALMGVGDAFRTGTHKAIIMTWLEREGRSAERTKVYGLTRSWSKIGSAVSAIIAGAIVFNVRHYAGVFWFAMIPYAADLVNLATYPAWLDGQTRPGFRWSELLAHFRDTGRALLNPALRGVLIESMSFHGYYAAVKDYLQPIVMTAALALPTLTSLADRQRTAIMIAIVYTALHIIESYASRRSHLLSTRCGSDENAACLIWILLGLVSGGLLLALLNARYWAAAAGFIALAALNNLFRPNVVSRVVAAGDARLQATVLSVESQLKSLFIIPVAPLIGRWVDSQGFWPLSVIGLLLPAAVIISDSCRSNLKCARHQPPGGPAAQPPAGG